MIVRKQTDEAHLDDVMAGLEESTKGLRGELETCQIALTAADRNVAELQTQKESLETAIELVQSR
jgi:hypothetical protein